MKIRKAFIAAIVLVFVVVGILWIWRRQQACMYWTGDHYQAISCNETHGDTLVIALDPEKLNHLKKITRPDTITERSIGKVWYAKINGNIEYFTSDGDYPPDPQRRLKRITVYMIRKYIHPEQKTEQVSQ